MKTHTIIKALMIMVFIALGTTSYAAKTPASTPATTEATEARMATLTERLEEIKAMDHKAMSRAEKKELRKEVRQIKEEMAAVSGGVYLSIGAILVIILLLILLV